MPRLFRNYRRTKNQTCAETLTVDSRGILHRKKTYLKYMEKILKSQKSKTTGSMNSIKAAGTKKMITNTEENEKT